jgi:hypothetical protein
VIITAKKQGLIRDHNKMARDKGARMTRLSARIILDKPGDVYHCGETISGTVDVDVHEECKGRKPLIHPQAK